MGAWWTSDGKNVHRLYFFKLNWMFVSFETSSALRSQFFYFHCPMQNVLTVAKNCYNLINANGTHATHTSQRATHATKNKTVQNKFQENVQGQQCHLDIYVSSNGLLTNTHEATFMWVLPTSQKSFLLGGGLRHTFSGPSVLYSSLVIQNRVKKNFWKKNENEHFWQKCPFSNGKK